MNKIEENENEFSVEELAFAAHDKIDALIDLLIEKKLITEKEFVASLKKVYEDLDEQNK